MCLELFLLEFILDGTLCFLNFSECFLSHVREIFTYNLFKYFLGPFLSLSFSSDPYNANISATDVVSKVS